jgi:hypothetical protein
MVSDKTIFMGISHRVLSILSQKVPKYELYKHNDELFNIYYGIFYELWIFAYFDRLWKLEKRGMKLKKKSSPLKLLSQGREPSNDYFIEILFLLSKWFQTRRFLWEFPIGSYVKLSSNVAAILWTLNFCLFCPIMQIRKKGDEIKKKNLLLWNYWLRRRFLCEFPIRSYVKLSSAVGAILIEGPNRRTHFWKRTIQWLFH